MHFFIFLIIFWLLPLVSHADSSKLEPITVTDTADSETKDVTASSTVIHTKSYQRHASTLSEVLEQQPSIHTTRFGGLEDFTSISIRGSASDQVGIFLDGIPLNTAASNDVDLSILDLDSIDSIEIYRGSSPLALGASPVAGSILLNSGVLKKGEHLTASVGYGSFNTVKNSVSYSHKKNRFGFFISNSYSRTDGDFSFLDDNGTPVNKADDQVTHRQNNASQKIHPFLKLTYDFDEKTHVEWIQHFFRKDSGVPGLAANQSQTANLDTTSYFTAFKIARDSFFTPNLSWEHVMTFRFLKNQYADLKGEIGLGGRQDNDDVTRLFGNQTTWRYALGNHHLLSTVWSYQLETYLPKNYLVSPSVGAMSRRHTLWFALGDEIDLLDHRLFLSPQISSVHVLNQINNDDPSFLTPATFKDSQTHHALAGKLGAKGVLFPWLTAMGNVSRGHRFPTFAELFGDQGGVVGNPFLDPEKSWNWDAGLKFKGVIAKQKGSLEVSYFEHKTDDLILFEQKGGFARAENIGSSRVRGLETAASLTLWKKLLWQMNYTYQDPRDLTTQRFLPGRPHQEFNSRFTFDFKKWNATVGLNWQDKMYLDPLNTRVVTSRVLLDSGISYQPFQHWTFSFEGKNLTDNQVVDVVGFPLPGRSFFGRVSYDL